MLLTNKLNTTIVPLNFKRLKLIHADIKIGDIIEIDIKDLSTKSPIKIECQCDICGTTRWLSYRLYIRNKSRQNYYSCKKCKNKKTDITKQLLYGDSKYNNPKKMILSKELKGIYIPFSSVSDFQIYRKIVNRFTYRSKKILFNLWDGYDFYDKEYIKDNLLLPSNNMTYPTIDHKVSIHEGFLGGIPPYIIGNIDNICITKKIINVLKRDNVSFDISKINF